MQMVLKWFARNVARYIERVGAGRLGSEVCKKEGLLDDMCRSSRTAASSDDAVTSWSPWK